MWRTLEDKNTDPAELQKLAEEEKPGGFITELLSPKALVSRRSFVQGSSIAALAAGLQGCVRRPENEIFPYSKAPEYLVPGVASHFATVTSRGRDALGVVVTSHDGRPTKVEGNKSHVRCSGATDVRAQAYIWDLYDPARSQSPAKRHGNALANATEAAFDDFLKELVAKHEKDAGAGLRFLAPISNSPTFRRLRDKVIERMVSRRHFVGSSDSTAPLIESSFREALDLLETHLGSRPFLFGGRPSFGDFGLWAQLYCAWTDPTGGAWIAAAGTHLVDWIHRMLWPGAEGEFESWDRLEPTLVPLLERSVGALFCPWTVANAAAIEDGREAFDVQLDGQPFSQEPQKYHAKSFAVLRARYAAIPDRGVLDEVLRRCGCLEAMGAAP